VEFRILGPLEVVEDGRRVELGGRRQRALLAILLLRPNQVVSTDQLMQSLWGERPQPTAQKALQGHVSQLRRRLGDGVIATRSPGYALSVDPDAIDARRFERLVAEGRELGADRPELAAERLRDALALRRGPPLQDFAFEEFAREEVARLEELELGALEDRIDADLALGRHGGLVAELEAFVAAHPLRERLRAQLMLALYRSHRQADALEVYQEGRRLLVDELGLEPSEKLQQLERAILRHDPSLDLAVTSGPAHPPARAAVAPAVTTGAEALGVGVSEEELASAEPAAPGAERPHRRRRRARLLAGIAVLALALVAALAILALTREDETTPTVVPNSIVKIDPTTNEVVEVVRVGRDPVFLAAVGEWVFATNLDEHTVSRVDVRSGEVRTVGGLGSPYGLAAAPDGTLWIGSDAVGEVTQVNPLTLGILRRVRIPGPPTAFLTAGAGSLWVSSGFPALSGGASVVRVGLPAGSVIRRFPIQPIGVPLDLAFGDGAAWVAVAYKQELLRIDAVDGTTRMLRIATYPSKPALGFHKVWIASSSSDVGRVNRVDPLTMEVDDVVRVGKFPFGVATGAGAVWATSVDGTVSRIDPRTNEVVATVRTGYHPHGVVVAGGAVWVAISAKHFTGLGAGRVSDPLPEWMTMAE
jgi:YVTN family beta-propeller protein